MCQPGDTYKLYVRKVTRRNTKLLEWCFMSVFGKFFCITTKKKSYSITNEIYMAWALDGIQGGLSELVILRAP